MAEIVRFHEIGGPEVLKIEEGPSRGPQRRSKIASSGYRAMNSRNTILDAASPIEPASSPKVEHKMSYNEYAEGYLITKNIMKWFWDNQMRMRRNVETQSSPNERRNRPLIRQSTLDQQTE